MKVGLISDVHGNLPALETVLSDLPDVDALVNAGDVVGYNPWPAACVEAMATPGESAAVPEDLAAAANAAWEGSGVPTVMGNHDRAVIEGGEERFNDMAQAGVRYARTDLEAAHRDWLSDRPDERRLFDGRLKVVHGHPDDPDHYTMPGEFGPDLLADEDVLVMGHTHVQHHEVYDEGVVLNPGSVGQPRDHDPRAAYAVVDLEELTVEEHRVEYDIERVQAAVEEAGLPAGIGSRLDAGR
ncbi:metallophosphoesterase [Halobacteriales archaeon QS_1_68_20]|nr:MAG: metallophosphoesterase [Halobacteriales archaeon QS_1_68_20]